MSRRYTVKRANGGSWKAYAKAFSLYRFETEDRRLARRAVRLAQRLGYSDVRFRVSGYYISREA